MTSRTGPEPPRVARGAALAVLWFSVPFGVLQVVSYAIFSERTSVPIIAAAAMLVGLPLHLQHLRYGLRGERPSHGGLTLSLLIATQLVALLVIGPTWAFSLSLVATSALIVLPWSWSLVTLACCLVAPVLSALIHLPTNPTTSFNRGYLELLVTASQFTPVWLIAAAHQLHLSRRAQAEHAATVERLRLEMRVWESLGGGLQALSDHARRIRDNARLSSPEDTAAALAQALGRSRSLLTTVRGIAARNRSSPEREGVASVARAAEDDSSKSGQELMSRRAALLCITVHSIVLAFPLLLVLGAFGPVTDYPLPLVVPAWLLLVVLQAGISLDTARGRRPRAAFARWLGMAVVAVVTLCLTGSWWSPVMWSVGAAGAMAFRHRRSAAGGAAIVSVTAYVASLAWDRWSSGSGQNWSQVAFDIVSGLVISAIVVVGLYASARMVHVISELERAREQLAATAASAARQQLFRDLHDVLGQRLTAITLKGELARHLLTRDAERAVTEIDDMATIAESLSSEVREVTRGQRQAILSRELEESVALLQTAGVAVRTDVDLDSIDVDAGGLLAWALREGTTNIVRHAAAQHCDIVLRHAPGRLVLELVNDGVVGSGRHGTGLTGLAARFQAAGGTVTSEHLPQRRFRLCAALPVRLQPAGVAGDADGIEAVASA